MVRRRQFREMEVIETLLLQGVVIPCFRCGVPLTLEDLRAGNIQKEHLHEVGLEGPDEPANCRFSHAARPCHATVTHGTPATSAGSSRHRIAKATDPERIEKFRVNKKPLDADRVGIPSGRCRRCGQDPCTCVARERRSAFGRGR